MTTEPMCLPECREVCDCDGAMSPRCTNTKMWHAPACPNAEAPKVKHDGWSCGCKNKLMCELAEEAQSKPTPAPEPKRCTSSRCDGVQHWLGDQSFACPNVCNCSDKPGPHTHAPEPKQGMCAGCGHQKHGVVCMNFASDNECPCKAGEPKQGSEEPHEEWETEVESEGGHFHALPCYDPECDGPKTVGSRAYLALRAEVEKLKAQFDDERRRAERAFAAGLEDRTAATVQMEDAWRTIKENRRRR